MFAEQFELTEDLRRSDNVLAALIESAIAALVLEYLDAVAPMPRLSRARSRRRSTRRATSRPGCRKRLPSAAGRSPTASSRWRDRARAAVHVRGARRRRAARPRHGPLEKRRQSRPPQQRALASIRHVEGQSPECPWACPWDRPLTRPQPPLARSRRVPARDHDSRLQVVPEPIEVRLEPGVAVVVGPNGSGKSNIADALLGPGSPRPVSCVPRSQTRRCSPEAPLARELHGEVELRFDDVGGACRESTSRKCRSPAASTAVAKGNTSSMGRP